MASSSGDPGRSPFEFLSYLPQGHEKALKQAVYNTATILFAAFVSVAGVAVYFILRPFLGPLLWAVLFGSVLHPFKRSLCLLLGGWLDALREDSTPLALGIVCLPFQVVDAVAERACTLVLRYLKAFLAVSVVVPCIYVAYHFLPVALAWKLVAVLRALCRLLSVLLEVFSSSWMVWSLLLGYVGALCFWWGPPTEGPLTALSPVIWLALVSHLASVAGIWRMPILVVVLALLVMGFLAELRNGSLGDDHTAEDDCPSPCVTTLRAGWAWLTGNPLPSDAQERSAGKPEDKPGDKPQEQSSPEGTRRMLAPALHVSRASTPDRRLSASSGEDTILPAITIQDSDRKESKDSKDKDKEEDKDKEHQDLSRLYLTTLVWACVLAQLWRYIWLLHLTYVPLLYTIIKRLGSHLNLWGCVREQSRSWCWTLRNWYEDRRQALFPAPVHGLWHLLRGGDKRMVSLLKTSIDSFTTVGIILLVSLMATVGTVFLAVQVYGESMHLVEVTSGLINRTVVNSPELQQLLPESLRNAQGALDSVLGDAYVYGRTWIGNTVRRVLDDADEAHAAEVERQMLELWDRAYHLWVARNASVDPALPHGPSWDTFGDALRNLDFSLLTSFVRDNIGTFMSVFESIWNVLKGNISVVLSVLTTTLSVLFGGGTAVLNFVLNFVGALSLVYAPMQWLCQRESPNSWQDLLLLGFHVFCTIVSSNLEVVYRCLFFFLESVFFNL